MMVNKKIYAMIKKSQEDMGAIQTAATEILGAKKATKAQMAEAIEAIQALADKFLADFGDVDPAWRRTTASEPVAAVETEVPDEEMPF